MLFRTFQTSHSSVQTSYSSVQIRALPGQLVEHGVRGCRRLGQPARAFSAVTAHSREGRTADDLGQLIRRAQLANETARGTHGRLRRVADLTRIDWAALDPHHHELAHRQVNAALRDARPQQSSKLGRHGLLEPSHAGSTRSSSPTTSVRTVPPSRSLPATISRAIGVSTSRWIARFNGRAPNTGS